MSFPGFLRENRLFLAAGVLLSFSSSYGQTYFISIFADEIMGTFNLSHGAWGGIYTLGTTASAILMVWVGSLTDRFRVRQLGVVVAVLLALSCLAMATVPSALALIFVVFALRLTGQGMMSHLSVVAMARWFVASRGRALAISSMGFAAGQALLPVVFVALLAILHWRMLWVLSAVLVLIALPILVWLLSAERTPQSHAESSSSSGMSNRHWQRSEVIRHWLFWLSIPVMLGPPCWGTALFFQQVHLTEVKGWALIDYVALLPFYTVASISATFASGTLIDRIGTAWLMQVYMLPFAAGFLVIGFATTLWGAVLGLILIGIGTGGQSTLPAAFWAEFFGTRHLGSIKAMSMSIMVFGSAVGPGLSGVLIDRGLDFDKQALGVTVYFLFAASVIAIGVRRARPLLPEPA